MKMLCHPYSILLLIAKRLESVPNKYTGFITFSSTIAFVPGADPGFPRGGASHNFFTARNEVAAR